MVARDRIELSTLRFSVTTKEATRGSGKPLPLILLAFRQIPDNPKPLRAATDCQSFVSRISSLDLTRTLEPGLHPRCKGGAGRTKHEAIAGAGAVR